MWFRVAFLAFRVVGSGLFRFSCGFVWFRVVNRHIALLPQSFRQLKFLFGGVYVKIFRMKILEYSLVEQMKFGRFTAWKLFLQSVTFLEHPVSRDLSSR